MTQRTFADPRRDPEGSAIPEGARWVGRAPPDALRWLSVLGLSGAVLAAGAVGLAVFALGGGWGGRSAPSSWPLVSAAISAVAVGAAPVALSVRVLGRAARGVRVGDAQVDLEFRPLGRAAATVSVDWPALGPLGRGWGGLVALRYRTQPGRPAAEALLTYAQARAVLAHPRSGGWEVDPRLRGELARSAAPGGGAPGALDGNPR